MSERSDRSAWADVDLGAVASNARLLAELASPALLCAVVKADGYGHGAVSVARAALDAGATWLAVALTSEGAQLRDAGVRAPILLLSEPPKEEHRDVVAFGLTPTVYTEEGIDSLARTASRPLTVHLKIDTGMHRVGVEPGEAVAMAKAIVSREELLLEGVWTHCAVADEPGHAATAVQRDRFEVALAAMRAEGIEPSMVHASNSAATIDQPALRYDMVRCGIALYGLDPSPALAGRAELRPAMRLAARVSHVHTVPAGDAVSYGLRRPLAADSVIAVVPIGYADGVPRRLFDVGGEVLIGGRRRPIAGVVTMDQILIDCGPTRGADAVPDRVERGDEVVLIGRQGGESIGADEWAARLGTISYEVVCGISTRVPRRYVR